MNIIKIIKKVFHFGKNNELNEDLKIICKDDKITEDYDCYPTENQYDENVNNIRRNELKSDRFIKTKKFIHNYNTRGNLDLEQELFKIVGTYGLDDDLLGKEYEYIRQRKEERYKKLKDFLNSLTEEQINSNIYLLAASTFMKTSLEDCGIIVKQLEREIIDLNSFECPQLLKVDYDIPEERLSLFPERISEQTGVLYYKPEDYKVSYINLLDEHNQYVYSEYNDYVRKNDKLANDIYHLQMWNLLSRFPDEINNYYFSIFNNSTEQKFCTGYFVKKGNKNIVVNPETTGENNSSGKLTYDIRVMIDGILVDRENIILMEEVNKEFENISDEPKVIVKVKK